MSDPIVTTIITTMGAVICALLTVIAAYLEKNRRDTNRIRFQTDAVHESINNRDEPLSDRIDRLATKKDLRRLERYARRGDAAVLRELRKEIDVERERITRIKGRN